MKRTTTAAGLRGQPEAKKRPVEGAAEPVEKVRTLTRSARQGGLLEQLILGDQPEQTVRRLWSSAEDALLRAAVKKIGARQWKVIASYVPDRSHIQCMQRWQKVLEPSLNKGFWSAGEDDQLRAAVALHGSSSWTNVAAMIEGRNCKQCRERWNNYLDPTLKKGNWDAAEDKALLQGREMFGDRWSLLSKLLPGRSQIQVRDRSKTLDLKAREKKGGGEAKPRAAKRARNKGHSAKDSGAKGVRGASGGCKPAAVPLATAAGHAAAADSVAANGGPGALASGDGGRAAAATVSASSSSGPEPLSATGSAAACAADGSGARPPAAPRADPA
eukprot:g6993.t1